VPKFFLQDILKAKLDTMKENSQPDCGTRGWITDLNATATFRVPAAALQRIVVELQQGSIRVRDMTRDRRVDSGAIQVALQAPSVRVIPTDSHP
jgi:hypothetical protein